MNGKNWTRPQPVSVKSMLDVEDMRPCLGPCGEMWLSPSASVRVCPRCKKSNQYAAGTKVVRRKYRQRDDRSSNRD